MVEEVSCTVVVGPIGGRVANDAMATVHVDKETTTRLKELPVVWRRLVSLRRFVGLQWIATASQGDFVGAKSVLSSKEALVEAGKRQLLLVGNGLLQQKITLCVSPLVCGHRGSGRVSRPNVAGLSREHPFVRGLAQLISRRRKQPSQQ